MLWLRLTDDFIEYCATLTDAEYRAYINSLHYENRRKNKIRSEIARHRDWYWSRIMERDGGPECAWCGADENLHIDHVFPVINGGDNRLENLQFLCGSCNSRKGSS